MKSRTLEVLTGYGFILPSLLVLGLFVIYPMFSNFYMSLYNWPLLGPTRSFVALKNYSRIFLQDPIFWISTKNTIYFVVGYVSLVTLSGLLIAVVLWDMSPSLQTVVRTICFLPVVSMLVYISLIWIWMYMPHFGLVNYLLSKLGIRGPAWLRSSSWAMPAIIFMMVWKDLGYVMVLYLAGLSGIPETYYEAANIDGANRWNRFQHITLPLLTPTTFFVVATGVIKAFQVFAPVQLMTNGGPGDATRVLLLRIYNTGFLFSRMGEAAALSTTLFLFILIVIVFQVKYVKPGF
ncbi:sugar ABC transporter permease [Patescibacteria group bacterium]|nr:sugar ABC transporter permease [Patescibacteria group bacterium]